VLSFAERVQAQAVVDVGGFPVRDRVNELPFIVTVRASLDGDRLADRIYQIAALDENRAAWAGLERYVREMDRSLN
jgi:hypothetical protein